MKKFFFILLLSLPLAAQLELTIHTDKPEYSYGELIKIICTVENNSDSTVTFYASNYESCQAEFILNDFDSYEWGTCLPTVEELIFPPYSNIQYSWIIDPYVFGLPDKDGIQTLVGYFQPGWNSFDVSHLKDTTTFNAPVFLGGQLILGFNSDLQNKVDSVRSSQSFGLINHDRNDYSNITFETWQILGMHIDSAKTQLSQINLFSSVEYNRFPLMYDSVIVTSIKENEKLNNNYILQQNYPNPFNPTTKIKFTVGTPPRPSPYQGEGAREGFVLLQVYNTLGQKIRTLVNKQLYSGTHEVTFDASNLPSGVYFYRLTSGNYSATKKMLLVR